MGYIFGTSGNDYLGFTYGNDVVSGLAGNDTLMGAEGIDAVYGGAGNDLILGSWLKFRAFTGADYLDGGSGFDLVSYEGYRPLGIRADLRSGTVSFAGHSNLELKRLPT